MNLFPKIRNFGAIAAFVASLAISLPVDAKSSFGGGSSFSSGSSGRSSLSSGSSGKSSFGSSGSSKPSGFSPSASYSKPSQGSSNSKSLWGSSKTSSGSTSASSTDKALASKSSMTGSSSNPQARSAAVSDFKAKNATKYNTYFSSEPSVRPSYVPPSYTDNYGTYRHIYYDRSYGGYGYWDAFGTFIVYDALSNAANRHANTVVYENNGSYSNSDHSFLYLAIGSILIVIMIVALVALARPRY